jgi:hypothetical protein
MDYTKFLNNKKEYKLSITNNYIKESITTLKDIKKADYILINHQRFNYKIEIDEYFAYFLKEKNDFIGSFQQYIKDCIKDPNIPEDCITVYKEILNILKSNLDNLITNFKIIKQNIYKKTKQQERFNEQKFHFFAEKEEDHSKEDDKNININNNNNINKINKKESIKSKPRTKINKLIKNIKDDFNSLKEGIKNKYEEASNVVQMLMDKDKQNYEKTKRILFDLSSLVTAVQTKLHEQGEMTKNILFNSLKSVDNIEEGNKHLTQAKEYQKGRGFIIGLMFIILGLFLILSDR